MHIPCTSARAAGTDRPRGSEPRGRQRRGFLLLQQPRARQEGKLPFNLTLPRAAQVKAGIKPPVPSVDQDGSCWSLMRSRSETPRCCTASERHTARGRNTTGLRGPGAPCCRSRGDAAREGECRRLQPRRMPQAGSPARAPGQPLTLAEPLGDYSSRISYKHFWREKSKYKERCSLSAAPDGAAGLTRTRLKPRDVAGHSQRAAEGERFSLALIIPLQSSVWARGGIRAS